MKNSIKSGIVGLAAIVAAATANAEGTNTTYQTEGANQVASAAQTFLSPYEAPASYQTKKELVTEDQTLTVYFGAEWTDYSSGSAQTGTVVRAFAPDGVTPVPLVKDLRLSYGDDLVQGLTPGNINYAKGKKLNADIKTGIPKEKYFLKAEFLN